MNGSARLAGVIVGLLALVGATGCERKPLVGQWGPLPKADRNGISYRVKKIALRKWADAGLDALPESARKNMPGKDKYYLYVEVAIRINGVAVQEMPIGAVTVGPCEVTYGGQRLRSNGNQGLWPGSEKDMHRRLWSDVSPWPRGSGGARIEISDHVRVGSDVRESFHFTVFSQ